MSSDAIHLPDHFPHGGGVEAAAHGWGCDVSDVLDLSTGLHPLGEPVWLKDWLSEHASLAGHYPDVQGEPARSALAAEFGVSPEQVLITAGAQAVIEIIFQAMGWQAMAIEVPCYNEPIRCATRSGCEVRPFEGEGDMPLADMLWHTSPSNPKGSMCVFPKGKAGVLDESYMTFAERRAMGVLPDVIRLGSLTKTFCIPGLRLGYVIADEAVIAKLKLWLPPWATSGLALHLLPELLPEADHRDAEQQAGRERLMALLQSCGWQVQPSDASFVLAKPTAAKPDFSAERILVREFPEWTQLNGWIRLGLPGCASSWQRLQRVLEGALETGV